MLLGSAPISLKSAVVSKESTKIDFLSAADKFWLGEQLNAARLSIGWDVPAAARLLNLSHAQVMAIEAGSQSPFMHTAHYIHNVQRYAQSMKAPQSIDVLERLERMQESARGEVAVSSQVMRINQLLHIRLSNDLVACARGGRLSRFGAAGVSMALILMGFVTTVMLTRGFDEVEHSVADHQIASSQAVVLVSQQSATLPSEPSQESRIEPVLAADVSERTIESVSISTQSKVLGFNFTAPCWVQITTSDGQVTDRLYQVSEVMYLNIDQTASLVIGNVTGAKAVTEHGHPVDFNAFVSGGNVARLKGQDLASLATYH
jgi:transcriptional regulator with XRE-family HTH domain